MLDSLQIMTLWTHCFIRGDIIKSVYVARALEAHWFSVNLSHALLVLERNCEVVPGQGALV